VLSGLAFRHYFYFIVSTFPSLIRKPDSSCRAFTFRLQISPFFSAFLSGVELSLQLVRQNNRFCRDTQGTSFIHFFLGTMRAGALNATKYKRRESIGAEPSGHKSASLFFLF
jgi:hypothetical protein